MLRLIDLLESVVREGMGGRGSGPSRNGTKRKMAQKKCVTSVKFSHFFASAALIGTAGDYTREHQVPCASSEACALSWYGTGVVIFIIVVLLPCHLELLSLDKKLPFSSENIIIQNISCPPFFKEVLPSPLFECMGLNKIKYPKIHTSEP